MQKAWISTAARKKLENPQDASEMVEWRVLFMMSKSTWGFANSWAMKQILGHPEIKSLSWAHYTTELPQKKFWEKISALRSLGS
jgi:hypothetical protein